MYRLYILVFVLIRVLRLWLPGRDNACPGPCYRPLKHGFFIAGFSFLGGLLGLLVAVVAVVPGRDPSIVFCYSLCRNVRKEGWSSMLRLSAFGPESHASCTSLEPFDLACA